MSNNDHKFGTKINNIQSSLKFFDFNGMNKDMIIEKYEEILCQREKQIRDIAYEIGVINEKMVTSSERIKTLEDENNLLNNKILKKDKLLEQELTNKDIMFIKLNNLQNENDKLQKKLQESGIDISSNKEKDKKNFFSGLIGKFSNKNKDDQAIQLNQNISKENSANEAKNLKNLNANSNLNTTGNTNKNTNNINTPSKNSITAISATLTQDLLNNIDLNKVSVKKSETNFTNETLRRNSNNTTGKTNSIGIARLSTDKRLASENIDYEPVFK